MTNFNNILAALERALTSTRAAQIFWTTCAFGTIFGLLGYAANLLLISILAEVSH